ncbi:MAG: metal-sulfur cluster assembly factor [Cellulomonadaceae bacterium]|jgi:metal-sulfur cluster biosynthetic enzyme|nr:metal-sulfur cluster assembly factor [Cellulomonadaceae bacterium]
MTPPAKDAVIEALHDVIDPELGINVVDLGLVYGVHIDDDGHVSIDMTLTTPACPLTDVLEEQTADVLADLTSSSHVNWVWTPAWSMDKITDSGRDQLRMLGFSI